MNKFWKKYRAVFLDYPATVADAGGALFDIGLHLLALSLPLTFPILYPLYLIWGKVKRNFGK